MVGMIGAARFQVTITPTVLNNDAYDANDVIFDRTAISHNMFTTHGGPFKLEQLEFWDRNDQTAANLTFVFLNADVTYGTADAAPSISDANSLAVVGHYVLASASILDHGDFKYACVQPNIIVQPALSTTTPLAMGTLWVAMASAGTPTYLTGVMSCRFTFSTL